MSLHEQSSVSDNVRRIINNGFYSHHPFKYSSGQLEDILSIFCEMRSLDSSHFRYCLDALKKLVEKNRDCVGCYGKGLAFIKLLTKGVSDSEYEIANDSYQAFSTARDRSSDFEQELLEKMHELGMQDSMA